MAQYKETLRLLFSSWQKTHEISRRISSKEIAKNNLRKVESNYRVKEKISSDSKDKFS